MNGVVEPPLQDFNGRYTEDNLDKEANIEEIIKACLAHIIETGYLSMIIG